jgi:hypothetical protein
MHSAGIFFGVLIFGWGISGLKLFAFIITKPEENDSAWNDFWDRWVPHLIAALMLPVPLVLCAGGCALVLWGFRG